MSIEISDALKDGFRRVTSRTGGILILAYLLVYLVYQTAFNTIVNAGYARIDYALPPVEPSLDVPLAAAGVIVLLCMVAMSYLTVVAIRTFVAGARASFPADATSRRIPFAVANLIVGGLLLVLPWAALFGLPVAAAVLLDGSSALLVALSVFLVTFVAVAYLVVSLLFMPIYVAAEDDTFVAGFAHSWALTRGQRLSVFLLLLVLVALAFGLSIPIGILAAVATLAGAGTGVSQLLNVALIAPYTMFQFAVLAVAFRQLRGDDAPDRGGAAASGAPTSPA